MLPFAESGAALPAPHHRAVHHAVGRIWRRRRHRLPVLEPPDPVRQMQGCDAHVARDGVRGLAAPQRSPALKIPVAVPSLAGAGLLGAGAWAVTVHMAMRPRQEHVGPPLPVAEPGSALLLISGVAVLVLVGGRRARRPRR
jgi:hypothetical protein